MLIDIVFYSTFWDGVLRKETIYGKDQQHPADVVQDAIDFLEEMKAKIRGK
jgi:hypothetical protein